MFKEESTTQRGKRTDVTLETSSRDVGSYSTLEVIKSGRDKQTVRLVGSAAGILELLSKVRLVGPTKARVLITGETGTGKNLIAELIHLLHETRWEHLFRRTNVGALVPDLAASQLFGHVKGAFTGAVRDFPGIVREADKGTLFLDQLSDAPANVQDMLLTLLEVGTINPVGGRKGWDDQTVDIRLVSATLESPEQLISERKIREDLFYRVMEYHIHLPPLRDRPNEIMPLARYFLERAHELREPGECALLEEIHPDAIENLLKYPWPGNVRELMHVIRAAVVLSRSDSRATSLRKEWLRFAQPLQKFHSKGYRQSLDDFKHDWAVRTLLQCGGNNRQAARMMGISQDQFRKLRRPVNER